MGDLPDGQLFQEITKGELPMPAFEDMLSEQERWQLIDYIRTFAPLRTAGLLIPFFEPGGRCLVGSEGRTHSVPFKSSAAHRGVRQHPCGEQELAPAVLQAGSPCLLPSRCLSRSCDWRADDCTSESAKLSCSRKNITAAEPPKIGTLLGLLQLGDRVGNFFNIRNGGNVVILEPGRVFPRDPPRQSRAR